MDLPGSLSTPSPPSSPRKSPESTFDPIVPLRQRQLPASFWQEPRAPVQPLTAPQQFLPPYVTPASSDVWPLCNSAMLPGIWPSSTCVIPAPPSVWPALRNPPCSCATCMRYILTLPIRVNDLYSRPQTATTTARTNLVCPISECVDPGCKVCTSRDAWQPDRLRLLRRSARYHPMLE